MMTVSDGDYVVPTRRIVSPSDLHAFLHSKTYTLINSFIEDLGSAVEDVPITPDIETSEVLSPRKQSTDILRTFIS